MTTPFEPSPRPAGSQHVLRWFGKLSTGEALATYPKTQGTVSTDRSGLGGTGPAVARFLLGDTSNLADPTTQFPSSVLDDSDPAGEAPHAPVVPPPGGSLMNATDQSITARTWCQNIRVTITPLDLTKSGHASPFFTYIGVAAPNNGVEVCLDVGSDSGLGTNTGFPVVCVPLDYGFTGGQSPSPIAPYDVDAWVEIKIEFSASR